jgi:signal transduction histidine kinase
LTPLTTPRRAVPRAVGWARRHPAAADAVVAAAMLTIGAMGLVQRARHPGPAAWAFAAALVLPMIWRRRYPVSVFAVTFGATLALWTYPGFLAARSLAGYAVLVSIYTVARHAPRRLAAAAAAATEAGVIVITLGGGWVRSFVYVTGLVAAAFFLGTSLRNRQAYLSALEERARRLEVERDQQARIAAAAERANIAREMHDIVAHSLAVIITMAEAAAAKRHSDTEAAAAAMEQVAETGRQALGQTRRVLGILRATRPGAPLGPVPGLAQLDALLEQTRSTGLTAELVVTGRRFVVPESAQLAAYRIVQEALTNTIKHSCGADRVRVRLGYREPLLEIDVIDNGAPGAAARADPETQGHGLVGMAERAALFDGSVTAGRVKEGWSVRARLAAS